MAKAKGAKKQWYTITAPKLFRSVPLGESYVYESEQLINKPVTQNLMNLVSDVKRQNINVSFKIKEVKNNQAQTQMTGYRLAPSSVKRLVRRNVNRVDMSLVCKTKDGVMIRIKPLVITNSKMSNLVGARMRKTATNLLLKQIAVMSYDQFTNDLVFRKLQETLKAQIKKVHPVRICEIRSMEITTAKHLTKTAAVEEPPRGDEDTGEQETEQHVPLAEDKGSESPSEEPHDAKEPAEKKS